MFVLIEFESVANRFRSSSPNTKKSWNFILFDSEVLDNLIIQIRKVHDVLVYVSRFLFG